MAAQGKAITVDHEFRRREMPVEHFHILDDEGWRSIEVLVASDRPIVVTTALAQGQHDVAQRLMPLLRSKRISLPGAPLLLVPCENNASAEFFMDSDFTCPVVVDRICWIEEIDGEEVFRTEEHLNWFVGVAQNAASQPLRLEMVRSIGATAIGDWDHFVFLQRRKLLLMNTVHTCFAFLALGHGHDGALSEWAQSSNQAFDALVGLSRACSVVLQFEFQDKSPHEYQAYAYKCIERIYNVPDGGVVRVLKNFSAGVPGSGAQLEYLHKRVIEVRDQYRDYTGGQSRLLTEALRSAVKWVLEALEDELGEDELGED